MYKNNIEPPKPLKSQRRLFQEYSEALVMAVILAIIIRSLLVQAFKIPSSSMEDTLLVGDHILVSKFVYGLRIPFTESRWPNRGGPERGDVIVFIFPEDRTKDFIKRVVAVEGDSVQLVNKKVLVNGKETDDSRVKYTSNSIIPRNLSTRDNMEATTVPKDHLFVMGDNRDQSHDSRFWGFVPTKDVRGKAFIIYYSANPFPNVRWGRLCNIIR
jgi:signal peptidase I